MFGSVAKKSDTAQSDIDLMVISDDITYADLFTLLEDVSGQLGRQVSPTIYTREELGRKLSDNNAFATRVMSQDKLFVIGDENALPP